MHTTLLFRYYYLAKHNKIIIVRIVHVLTINNLQESTKYTHFVVMFQRTARLPIDISHDQFSDPAERLANYRASAVEETASKERTELLIAIKGNIEQALKPSRKESMM